MPQLSSRNGFTLVEAVVSTALLVLVIGGSFALVNRSQALIYAARNHYVAINISRARLERARNFAYDQLQGLAESNVVVNDSGSPASDGYFRRTTQVITNYQPGLTKIDVRTDIRNSRTLEFTGDNENVASLYTEYLNR
jgi:type II secretory pathway pseudopilin PulG